jgi:hypothetical protein
LIVLVAIGLLSIAVGLVAPVADHELRQGRGSFRSLSVATAARAGLTELERGSWLVLTAGVPVGGTVMLPPTVLPRILIERELHRVGAELWFATALATARDRGGGLLAASRQGLLLRVAIIPPDTIPRAQISARPWVGGFE